MISIPIKIKLEFNKKKPSIKNGELVINLSVKIPKLSKFWMFIVAAFNCLILSIKSLIENR